MSSRRVHVLGGNGHCAARLLAAQAAAERLACEGAIAPLALTDVAYPGFEARPRAPTLGAFLAEVTAQVRDARFVYATGIGALFALALRARGVLPGVPILMQAPVLWGLERRWMPRLLRFGPARRLLPRAFASSAFQAHFVRRHFLRPPAQPAAFFAGYAECAAFVDLFDWLTPAFLRSLETELAARPGALEGVRVWWGARDRVVTPQELAWTEAALGVRWPLRVFPEWGHYPMIDAPEDWVWAVSDALRPAPSPRAAG